MRPNKSRITGHQIKSYLWVSPGPLIHSPEARGSQTEGFVVCGSVLSRVRLDKHRVTQVHYRCAKDQWSVHGIS